MEHSQAVQIGKLDLKTQSWKNSYKDVKQSKKTANSAVFGFGVDYLSLKPITLLLSEKKNSDRGFALELI